MAEKIGRRLESVEFGDYILLSSEKLRRVLNFLDGISKSLWGENAKESDEDVRLRNVASSMEKDAAILALYDRIGGGIRTKEGRKVALGTFYDFEKREPVKDVKIGEEQFEDKTILVRKEKKVVHDADADLKERLSRARSTRKKVKEDE